jgi:2-polyprenyl-6-methoxyphenol hydroxylase-like FAD-dependent oxidoreductase
LFEPARDGQTRESLIKRISILIGLQESGNRNEAEIALIVLIAGAGIGGLSLSLALQQRGIEFVAFDAAAELKPLGVGINILPHAAGELAEFGILDEIDSLSVKTRELRYVNKFGQHILSELRGRYAGHNLPQFSIHRGMLHATMLKAVRARAGQDAVLSGHRLETFTETPAGVVARFRKADGELVETSGDMLVGADGIHSAVRAQLHPADGGMLWNGTMMWRGTVDWPTFDGGDTMIVSGDMKEKLLLYPIGPGKKPGTMLTNWVLCGELQTGISAPPERESWSRRGTVERARPYARNFKLPDLDVMTMIEATPEFFEYPMCDREPLTQWGTSRVTLLGDAAHPMYPVGSNGAAQSIIDGKRLGHFIESNDPEEAIRRYESERIPVTSALVRSNRQGGPERVVDVVSERAPNGFDKLEDVISREELVAISKGYAKMAGFSLNETPT